MKPTLKNTTLLLLVFILPMLLFAQKEKVHFTKIDGSDGLPQNHVFSMTQDSDGYVWVCTLGGLGKYNGNRFVNYKYDLKDSTSIPSSWVYKFFEDSKGRSYVATTKGFAEFNKKNETFISYNHDPNKNSLSNNNTRDLLEIENGNIAIATGAGIDLFNPETKEFINYFHPKFSWGRHTPCLLYDDKQQLWAGSVNGLYKVVEGQKELNYYPLINENGRELNIFNLIQDSFGTIWAATNRGLYSFDPKTEKFQLEKFGQEENIARPLALLEYPKGNLYVGTGLGLYHWNIKEDKLNASYLYASDNPEGISVNKVYSLMKDRENNIWIGLFRGINIINPESENFKLYYNDSGLNNLLNTILLIHSDSKGRLWTNTMEGLILKENINAEPKDIFLPYDLKKGFKNIKKITEDEKGDIWILTAKEGLFKTENQSSEFIKIEDRKYFNVNRLDNLVVDVINPDFLWLATSKGLCKYNRKTRDTTWVRPHTRDTLKNNYIGSLAQHEDGNLWFVNNKSLCVYNQFDDSLKYYKSNKNDSTAWYSGWAYNIEPTKNRIYLSGDSFSYLDLKTDKFVNYNEYNTPGDYKVSSVLSVLEADNGKIWFKGGGSVWEFNPKNDKLKFYNVLKQSGGFITNAQGKTKDGKLLFGASNGVFEVDPDKIKISKFPPKVVLSNFKVSNKNKRFDVETQFVNSINLKPEDNIFTVEFTALQFTNEQILNYKYQLEGFDKDWVDAEFRNEVTYTNLDPGNYIFKVEAINPQGLKSKESLKLAIYIEPKFWQTNFFNVIVFLSISSILFLLYLNRKRLQKLKEEKLVAEQSAIYKTKFLANMSHEFRTPMNAIMGLNKLMITSELTEKQQEYAKGIDLSCENLLWIINDILDQSKIESGKMTIRKQPFNVKDVVDQISLLLKIKMNEKELDFNINIDPEIPKSLIGDPTRVFQILTNLVGNAIKFTEKGSIDLNIKLKDNNSQSATLLFEVKDTGIGIPTHKIDEIFKSFEQVYSEKNNKYYSEGTGLGLSISKELVEQMGGTIYLKSEEGKGSNFFFDLTFKISNEKFSPEEKIKELTLPENLRILLVEDTPINRFLVIELLKQHLKNVTIEIAENGKIATEKIKSKNFDLVLMDIKMPVMDGLEATKLIRSMSDDYFKTVPILGLSANAIPQQIQEAKDMGMNACITKPIYLPELINSISILTK